MNNPKIYIIILNYNNWWDTIECLESVLRNDYSNYQVIVIDNNSPNNSMEYIKAWAEGKLDVWVKPEHPLRNLSLPPVKKPIPYVYYTREEAEKEGNQKLEKYIEKEIPDYITTKYPLIFIQTGHNGGFAFGNNVGIKYALAKGDFDSVILLNNDTVIRKDTIKNLVEARLKFGEKAIYGGRIYYYSEPRKLWYDGGHFNEWLGRAVHIDKGTNKLTFKPIQEVTFISFCFVLIPKYIIKEVGLLDESYFMYVEDLDFSYKIRKKGFKLYHLSSSQVWHKVGASSEEDVSEFSAYWIMKNRIKFIRSTIPFPKKIFSLAFILFSRPISFFKFYKLKKIKIIHAQIRGIIDGIAS